MLRRYLQEPNNLGKQSALVSWIKKTFYAQDAAISQSFTFLGSQHFPEPGFQRADGGVHCVKLIAMRRIAIRKELKARNARSHVRILLGACSLYMRRATDTFPDPMATMYNTREMKIHSRAFDTWAGCKSKTWRAPPIEVYTEVVHEPKTTKSYPRIRIRVPTGDSARLTHHRDQNAPIIPPEISSDATPTKKSKANKDS